MRSSSRKSYIDALAEGSGLFAEIHSEFPTVRGVEWDLSSLSGDAIVKNVVLHYRVIDDVEMLKYEINCRIQERRLAARRTTPLNAHFLLYLLYDARKCDALVGDLEERYKLIHKKFGARRANFWYWTQTVTSVAPIVWAATKRVMTALTGVAALVEFYKKIRL